ncbi:hypothetical protein NMY22_g13957 [Coprinellus aureogranulatus]|nr:hypothetical protein NMY22_g13957 [Coprinellus aureogranulatus]
MFVQGSDLTNFNGFGPWRIHLLYVFKGYPGLRQVLLNDGFIPSANALEIEGLMQDTSMSHRRILETISDPFMISMKTPLPHLTILHPEHIFSGQLPLYPSRPISLQNVKTGIRSGKALARFEMADVPETRPTNWIKEPAKVVLRVLKIVEPPNLKMPRLRTRSTKKENCSRFSMSLPDPRLARGSAVDLADSSAQAP